MDFVTLLEEMSFFEICIILALVVMSVISWSIIFSRSMATSVASKRLATFENVFWSGIELGKYYQEIKPNLNIHSGIDSVFYAGFREYRRLEGNHIDADSMIEGVQRAMRIAINKEEEHISRGLTFLATVGSISPYIGLFGTVVGIMRAFLGISAESATTLAAVAPGIAAALTATGMGLFAAIPAVWGYNNVSARVNYLLSTYHRFAEEFASILYRKSSRT